MGPYNLTADWGSTLAYVVPLLIGIGFGAALEMSGFGDSRKLAAQFYLKDLTVLKVMFTAIVVASALLLFSSAFGLLDFDGLFVNPTYLLPGLVGGLIMGVGFIVGGFCPGTSLVAASTLKIDGIFFVVGVSLGVLGFGSVIEYFDRFWYSTAYGRLTLADVFGVDAGVVLLGVVVMALAMFLLSEVAEQYFGRHIAGPKLRWLPRRRLAWTAMGALFLIGSVTVIQGQPDPHAKWAQIAGQAGVALESRNVYVHPMEMAELGLNPTIYARVIDVRSEAHYNLFHLKNSQRATLDDLLDPGFVQSLKAAPLNTVFVCVSNDESNATQAWKLLKGQGVFNLYILEGGINNWLTVFPPLPCLASPRRVAHRDEEVAFDFVRAVGDCCNSADPELAHAALPQDCYLAANPETDAHSRAGPRETPEPQIAFERKVKLEVHVAAAGGCG